MSKSALILTRVLVEVTVFRGMAIFFPVVFHICQEARASRFNALFPRLTPGDHQVTNFPALDLLGAGVNAAADTCNLSSGNVGSARAIAGSHGEKVAFQEAVLQA